MLAFYVVADIEGEGRWGVALVYDCSVGCYIIEHYTLAVAIATDIDIAIAAIIAAVVIVIVVVIVIAIIVCAASIADITVNTIVAVLRIERRTGKGTLVPDPSDPPPIRAVTHNFRFRE